MAHNPTPSDPSESIQAIEQNLSGAFTSWGAAKGCELHDDGDLKRLVSGIPHPLLNGVFDARLPALDLPAAEERVRAVWNFFNSRDLPFTWWVGPLSQPIVLGELLTRRGFLHDGLPGADCSNTGMITSLNPLPTIPQVSPALTVEPVIDEKRLRPWLQVFFRAFALPSALEEPLFSFFKSLGFSNPWRHFLASLDGIPVATSSLFLGSATVGVYCVGTLPEARRQGAGTLVTWAAMREGQKRGYRTAILGATSMGYPIYRRLGFAGVCQLQLYICPHMATVPTLPSRS